MGYGDEKLSKYLTQAFITHCNAMICQQVTLSGDAEWPKVADAVIEAPLNTYFVIAPADAMELPQPPLATLIQYVQQKGCSRTGRAIATAYDNDALIKQFVTHAEHQRGILCSVEYPVEPSAFLERGQKVFFRFPMGSCY